MSIPNQVFTYWQTPSGHNNYPFIEYCLKSFRRSGCTVHIVNESNVDAYLEGAGLHPNWKRVIDLAEKTDCIRMALLYKYGGFWADADTVIIRSFQNLLNNDSPSFLRWSCTGTLLNGYFMAQAQDPFIKNVLEQINWILEYEFQEKYCEKGGGCYMGQTRINQAAIYFPYKEIPLSTFIPLEFPPDHGCWYREETIDKYIHPETVAIALNLSQYEYTFKTKAVQEHMGQNNLFGSIFRVSEGINSLL